MASKNFLLHPPDVHIRIALAALSEVPSLARIGDGKNVRALRVHGKKRILSGLKRGDLVWEVPQESYFVQFEEASGRQNRVPLKVLLEMGEHGWIRCVPQGPQRCDYWEITDAGRDAIRRASFGAWIFTTSSLIRSEAATSVCA